MLMINLRTISRTAAAAAVLHSYNYTEQHFPRDMHQNVHHVLFMCHQ